MGTGTGLTDGKGVHWFLMFRLSECTQVYCQVKNEATWQQSVQKLCTAGQWWAVSSGEQSPVVNSLWRWRERTWEGTAACQSHTGRAAASGLAHTQRHTRTYTDVPPSTHRLEPLTWLSGSAGGPRPPVRSVPWVCRRRRRAKRPGVTPLLPRAAIFVWRHSRRTTESAEEDAAAGVRCQIGPDFPPNLATPDGRRSDFLAANAEHTTEWSIVSLVKSRAYIHSLYEFITFICNTQRVYIYVIIVCVLITYVMVNVLSSPFLGNLVCIFLYWFVLYIYYY